LLVRSKAAAPAPVAVSPILHLAKGHFVLLCKINDMGECRKGHLCGCDGLRHPIAIFIVNGAAPKLEIKICRKAKRPQNRTKKIERSPVDVAVDVDVECGICM